MSQTLRTVSVNTPVEEVVTLKAGFVVLKARLGVAGVIYLDVFEPTPDAPNKSERAFLSFLLASRCTFKIIGSSDKVPLGFNPVVGAQLELDGKYLFVKVERPRK